MKFGLEKRMCSVVWSSRRECCAVWARGMEYAVQFGLEEGSVQWSVV